MRSSVPPATRVASSPRMRPEASPAPPSPTANRSSRQSPPPSRPDVLLDWADVVVSPGDT